MPSKQFDLPRSGHLVFHVKASTFRTLSILLIPGSKEFPRHKQQCRATERMAPWDCRSVAAAKFSCEEKSNKNLKAGLWHLHSSHNQSTKLFCPPTTVVPHIKSPHHGSIVPQEGCGSTVHNLTLQSLLTRRLSIARPHCCCFAG